MTKKVPLGEIQTDEYGRLLVLGGLGTSGPEGKTLKPGQLNNDGWYDDTSDGPVIASVRVKGTNDWIQASPAWVICAPPKFTPFEHIITLYDSLRQNAVKDLGAVSLDAPEHLSFRKDIYPLLLRAMNMKRDS